MAPSRTTTTILMLRIIAHSPAGALRTALHAGLRAGHALVAGLGSGCPACGGAARGGRLCPPCVDDVLGGALPRCARCALRLSTAMAPRAASPAEPCVDARSRLAGAQPTACALPAPLCLDCRLHPPAFAQAVAAFDYESPFDSLIHRFKGEHRFALAGALAHLVCEAWRKAELAGPPVALLVPIPASRASLRRRGFNAAGELAAALGAQANVPVWRTALRRCREDGRRQASLARRQRETAVHGLYTCPRPMPAVHVGLVDDVMTTGSTVDAAARALLQAGAARVTVFVAARTPDDS